MVAPADPKGINRVGAPAELDHRIDAWGYVHGRIDRNRRLLGFVLIVGGAIAIILLAFVLHRVGTPNLETVEAGTVYRSGQMSEKMLADTLHRKQIRSVLRLVGDRDSNRPGYEAVVAGSEAAGAELMMAKLPATRLPWRSELADLFRHLDRLADDPGLHPVLFH
jgi:hypothetical protein